VAAIAAPADKRFRRPQFKPARKRKSGARHAGLVVRVAIVLAVAAYGGWRGTELLLGAPALQVSRISVRGNDRLSTGEVLSLIDGLRGRNILFAALDEWRQRLLSSPWVEDALLRRVLPSRIEVVIHERRPIGIARLGSAMYLVDAAGIVIDEYGPNFAEFDLPIIDGLAGRPNEAVSAVDEGRARLAARVIRALATRPDLAQRVSQIDVTDTHDAVVLLEGDTAMLRLGTDDFVDRLQSYLDLAAALHERVPDIDYVDLRFDHRLYVRPVTRE
jgi:cell division protein FtsQ